VIKFPVLAAVEVLVTVEVLLAVCDWSLDVEVTVEVEVVNAVVV
jgi:hypothetical protein